MGDVGAVLLAIAIVAVGLGVFMLYGLRLRSRRTPAEVQADAWRSQADLLDLGRRDPREFERVLNHFPPEAREEWRVKLVKYQALVDAGLSRTGVLLHLLGSPDNPDFRLELSPEGEATATRAVAEYEARRFASSSRPGRSS